MIRALSLAAALALLPLSSAMAGPKSAPEEALEAAAKAFEIRMEDFGRRAEAIAEDKALTETQRDARLAALWAEYQPALNDFTKAASEQAGAIAQAALAEIDVEALVADALKQADAEGAIVKAGALAAGMAQNGAWATDDPEQMATYGLIAQYAIDQATDEADAETDETEED